MGREGWQAVAGQLAQAEARGEFSGAVLVTVRGQVVLEACHGLADRAAGVAVRPATRFALASLCKMFTAVAVLDAAGRGELRLDASVARVLPADRRPATLRPDVTVHHLLTHTSGIADYAEEDEDLPGYVADYATLWHDLPSYRMRQVADFLPLFADRPPYGPPGERFRYCNAGYLVLGLVLEEATGREFTEVVTDRVLQQSGMPSSGYFALDEPRPDLATGYLPPSAEGIPWRSNVFAVPVVGGPDGGAFATAGDVERFLRTLDADGPGPRLREAVLTPRVDVADGVSMGYGVFLGEEGWFGHGGGDPGVATMARRWPRLDTTVVVLCNVEGSLEVAWEPIMRAVRAG